MHVLAVNVHFAFWLRKWGESFFKKKIRFSQRRVHTFWEKLFSDGSVNRDLISCKRLERNKWNGRQQISRGSFHSSARSWSLAWSWLISRYYCGGICRFSEDAEDTCIKCLFWICTCVPLLIFMLAEMREVRSVNSANAVSACTHGSAAPSHLAQSLGGLNAKTLCIIHKPRLTLRCGVFFLFFQAEGQGELPSDESFSTSQLLLSLINEC